MTLSLPIIGCPQRCVFSGAGPNLMVIDQYGLNVFRNGRAVSLSDAAKIMTAHKRQLASLWDEDKFCRRTSQASES